MAKILIAEDERDIRDLITFTLSFGGYEVVSAGNGEEAVTLAKQELPDLILLDVRMPRMTGYEACAAIKADNRLKDIPVIFLSAKGQETEIQAGLQAGATEYLLKPFAPDQLTARIKTVLARAAKGPEAQIMDVPKDIEKPVADVVKEPEKPAVEDQQRPVWPLADSLKGPGEFFQEETNLTEEPAAGEAVEPEKPLIDNTKLPDWMTAGDTQESEWKPVDKPGEPTGQITEDTKLPDWMITDDTQEPGRPIADNARQPGTPEADDAEKAPGPKPDDAKGLDEPADGTEGPDKPATDDWHERNSP